jgi:hypothetical protein
MKTQYTKEQLADFLKQSVEDDFLRYREEFRQEQLEIYRAKLEKEAKQINEIENTERKSDQFLFNFLNCKVKTNGFTNLY